MKTTLIRLASALALTTGLTGMAHATHFDGGILALELDFGPGLTQFARVSDTFSGQVGDTFTDSYTFSVPPVSDDIDFTFSADNIRNHVTIAFTDVALFAYQPGVFVGSIPLTVTGTSSDLRGSTIAPVDVGQYLIEVSGTLLSADASYGGSVFATVSSVPEPSTWLLMGLGLGATAWFGMRRKGQAA